MDLGALLLRRGKGRGGQEKEGERRKGRGGKGGEGRGGEGKGHEPPTIWRKFTPMAITSAMTLWSEQ